ncbi:Holliday junction resolvase RuvX [Tessaracoccus antarcticus]|uniref:Putative pre-16S rRNA nuclease n=2 Tax=Tessaracoccus antarcticus TaxID=2479848 RepID=A0A3M0G225_9ACTN|nr:Holliday junction resolvase RuvX [Tessaracoccus antarcticus]
MGVDWGKVRIGVAACNAGTTLSYPVETVQAGAQELQRIAALAAEYEPGAIYVGLPLTLSGERQQAAKFVMDKAEALAALVSPLPVRLIDERMSTASASRSLSGAGHRAKQQRRMIDQAAAVEILQRAIEWEARTSSLAGEPVGEGEAS